jgi:hypothetical protein
VTLGVEAERSDFENTFLENAYGAYSFANIEDFALGDPSRFAYQYTLDGRSPTVSWGYTNNAVHLQDRWQPLRALTLTAGVRVDRLGTNDRPRVNAQFAQAFGRRNDHTFDGATTIAPRLSVIWKLDEPGRTTLRGGAGVFQGRAPGVWLSNPFSNDGAASLTNTSVSGGFSPDPFNQPRGNPGAGRQRVDLLDDNFKMPTVARANLALDRRLPWDGFIATAEVTHTRALEGLAYRSLNLRQTAVGPDGRAIYGTRTGADLRVANNSYYQNAAYSDVYLLTNTSRGDATQLTLSVHRPLRGNWALAAAYTRGRARDASPMTSRTAGSNFARRASLNPNAEEIGTANTQIRDRFLASATWRIRYARGLATKLTLAYEGRSGRPYSFIFSNDINGDSADVQNDLFYVPAGRADPLVRWRTPAEADAFFAYLATNPRLARFAGRVAPRNSERSAFIHQFDLKFTQEISLGYGVRGELFGDIINLGNLLNPEWGRVEQAGFPYTLGVAGASYDAATNQYVYRYTNAQRPALQPGPSRWQIQGGVRLKF